MRKVASFGAGDTLGLLLLDVVTRIRAGVVDLHRELLLRMPGDSSIHISHALCHTPARTSTA